MRDDLDMDEGLDYVGCIDPKLLWRYITVAKYMSLLATKTLYFSRADLLGDKYEGTYRVLTPNNNPFSETNLPNTYQISSRIGHAYVCSFHWSSRENDGMWRLYTSRSEGIAIVTDTLILAESLPALPSGMKYWLRPIKYQAIIRPETLTPTQISNPIDPFFLKDSCFKHESEARIVLLYDPETDKIDRDWIDGPSEQPVGLRIPIDLNRAIRKVLVSPDMPDWLSEAIIGITRLENDSLTVGKSEIRFRVWPTR
ncbi:MAG: hypothetical protein SGJ05_10985 [bacterium]|nr:hypothetical protein [bacterium]